jgi:hypothetical protein
MRKTARWIWRKDPSPYGIVDDVLADAFGIGFQYFTIAPMRDLSLSQGILAAVKAETFVADCLASRQCTASCQSPTL